MAGDETPAQALLNLGLLAGKDPRRVSARRRFPQGLPRGWIGGLAAVYGLFLVFAAVVWVLLGGG